MVKNRSQQETDSGLSLEEGRQSEKMWFKNSPFSSRKDVLGVEALNFALTSLLVGHIEEALPSMRQEIELKLDEAVSDLKKLGDEAPRTALDCRALLGGILRKWSASMRRVCANADYSELGSGAENMQVLQVELSKRQEFLAAMRLTKPGFDGERDSIVVEVTETCLERKDERTSVSNDREIGKTFTSSWKSKKSVTRIGEVAVYGAIINPCPFPLFAEWKVSNVEPYFRGDLKRQIGLRRRRELPGFMNFTVFKLQMGSYVSLWEPGSESFRVSVSNAVQATGSHFLEAHSLGHLFSPRLNQCLSRAFEGYVAKANIDAAAKIRSLLYQESQIPLTMNHYLWDTINKIRDERMVKKLEKLTTKSEGYGDYLSKAAVIDALKSDVGNDSNESQEVNDMIDILKSYWKLAMKRYVDGICAIVSGVYTSDACLEAMAEHVDKEMVSGLDDVKVQELFVEPSALLAKRRCPKERVERLTFALQRVREF